MLRAEFPSVKSLSVRRRRRSRWPWIAAGLLLIAIPLSIFAVFFQRSLQFSIDDIGAMPQRATVFDMDGKPYARLYGENRLVVPLDQVSPKFIEALLAREDSRFYRHFGIDPIGVARAAFRNLTSRSKKEGASTLTQQLARNSLPLGGQTLSRKLLEACIALRIEQRYAKKEILEHYINRIYYGGGLYGIEAASLTYFGKSAKDLNLAESALMAGLIRSPNRFSPIRNPKGATTERNVVLGRMVQLGFIKQADADLAMAEVVSTSGKPRVSLYQENYAMDAIKRDLDTILEQQQQDDGGLQIYATIDPELQAAATKALEESLTKIESQPGWEHPRKAQYNKDGANPEAPTEYLQGALVVIDNRSGAIRALVGGRDFAQSKFNRAILAKRQVGSSFKPFIYAAAFQRGLLPGAAVSDGPIEPGELHDANGGQSDWSPGNSDGQFGGIQPVENGLIRSRNTMSARVGELVGLPTVMKTVQAAGLARDVPNTPTVYLGAFESTLKDLTAAYTAFPNNGVRRQPYLIERIDDAAGENVYRAAHLEKEMFSPGAAWLTSTILEKVLTGSGTAARARGDLGFKLPAGGKTGTTNEFKDAWFVGYTSTLTCGVWVGLDKPATIMRRGYGSALALPIWTQLIGKAPPKRYPADPFKSPEPVKKTHVCAISNQLATAACDLSGKAYSVDLPVSMIPADACSVHGGLAEDNTQVRPALPVNPNDPRASPTPPPGGDRFDQKMMRSLKKFFGR
jgi:penicillin-binding protein 1A